VWTLRTWRSVLARLVEDEGQDLIEYALLTSVVAVVNIAVFQALMASLAAAYTAFDTSQQALWTMPDPAP
jgi:Flp pilus assembly pilin Flp